MPPPPVQDNHSPTTLQLKCLPLLSITQGEGAGWCQSPWTLPTHVLDSITPTQQEAAKGTVRPQGLGYGGAQRPQTEVPRPQEPCRHHMQKRLRRDMKLTQLPHTPAEAFWRKIATLLLSDWVPQGQGTRGSGQER